MDEEIKLTELKKEKETLEKQIKKLKTKNASELENMKRMQYENASNEIWHRMMKERSVCKKVAYCEFFAKRTWKEFEDVSCGCMVVLIGNEREKTHFFNRYKEMKTICFNPELLSWNEIEGFLREDLTREKVMYFILNQEWEKYVGCLHILNGTLENIFVYKFMEYNLNQSGQLGKTWEELLKDIDASGKSVLITPNPRAQELIRNYKEELKIDGVVTAKKGEVGKPYHGYTVQFIDNITELYDQNTVFILCSVNWNDYINELNGKGFQKVYSLRLLFRGNRDNKYSQVWKNIMAMSGMCPVNEALYQSKIEQLYTVCEDDDSKKTVAYVLRMRKDNTDDNQFIMQENFGIDPDYFEQSFLSFCFEETYLDIGPQDGGTIDDFVRRVNNQYKNIMAWEIGKDSLRILNKKYKDKRIQICSYGAWNENTIMSVGGTNGGRHLQSDDGENEIMCRRIDDVVDCPVTLIKMDIEGAEMNALLGARETIKKYKPKLMISLYHKPNDIWELPLFVKELVPEYKIYIRHHRTTPNDTVLYAVL